MMVNSDECDREKFMKALSTCQAAKKKCESCCYRYLSPYCVEAMLGDALERIWYLEGSVCSLAGYKEIIVKHIHKHNYEED